MNKKIHFWILSLNLSLIISKALVIKCCRSQMDTGRWFQNNATLVVKRLSVLSVFLFLIIIFLDKFY